MQHVTDYGVLDGVGLPADLTHEEATRIAKARWDAMMDVFDERMKALHEIGPRAL